MPRENQSELRRKIYPIIVGKNFAVEVSYMEKMKYKMSSRATILLGRESVSRVDGAIIELVKNTDIWPSDNSKINVVDSEGFIDPCTEEYDKHLIRLPDSSISGITPLGKYMRKTLQLYLKRHEIIHNLDKLKRKRDELKNSVAKDKLQGKECRKKEAALQLITESFFEYFNLWEKISQESA